MGLILDPRRAREERWVVAGNGVELKCKPATHLLLALARGEADRMMIGLKEAQTVVTKAGGRIDGILDLSSPAAAEAMWDTLFVVALAEVGITDWRNVNDADGKPLPFNAELVSELATDEGVVSTLRNYYLTPLYERRAEGNA